jgi:hypothetical protein
MYMHTHRCKAHTYTRAHVPWIKNFVTVEAERREVTEMQTVQK